MPSRDLFAVFVDGVNDKQDEVDAVRAVASKVSARRILAQAETPEELVRLAVEASVRAAATRIQQQVALVRAQVRDETREMARTDIRRVGAVSSVALATRRAERLAEVPDAKV